MLPCALPDVKVPRQAVKRILAMSVLEKELAYFEQRKADLLAHNRGQFAVIKDDQLLGTFTTFTEAFAAGVKAWGNMSFLVKEVAPETEPVQSPALSVGMLYARP